MKGSFDKAQDGQMLIEVLVALGTAVVVLSATMVAVLSALNNAQFSKNQNIATQYAQEGMEIMRKMRNSNWSAFNALSTLAYCLDKGDTLLNLDDARDDNNTPQGCSSDSHVFSPLPKNIDDFFARRVDIEEDSALCGGSNQTKVTVSVSWSSNKCTRENLYCHNVKLVSCLRSP